MVGIVVAAKAAVLDDHGMVDRTAARFPWQVLFVRYQQLPVLLARTARMTAFLSRRRDDADRALRLAGGQT